MRTRSPPTCQVPAAIPVAAWGVWRRRGDLQRLLARWRWHSAGVVHAAEGAPAIVSEGSEAVQSVHLESTSIRRLALLPPARSDRSPSQFSHTRKSRAHGTIASFHPRKRRFYEYTRKRQFYEYTQQKRVAATRALCRVWSPSCDAHLIGRAGCPSRRQRPRSRWTC